jgi:hypothetical protein
MSIVDFNDRMREYGDTLRYLQPSSRKGSKKSADADWAALESITEEDVRTATYDALPQDYKTHIDGQYEVDFRDMDEVEFLEAMISYETIDKNRRALRDKEKEKKKESSKKSRKRGAEPDNKVASTKNTHPYMGGRPGKFSKKKEKKFCQNCKDADGKYWTHDTDECFVKEKAEKAKKEANAMQNMQKQMAEMSDLVKGLKKKLESDGESD